MNRRILIALVLCTLMLGILGAGVVTAKQDERAPQADRVQQFDVTCEGRVIGKLIVNTEQLTYAFHGHGLTEGTTYYLKCSAFLRSVSAATAAKGGIVHMQGTCDQWVGVLAGEPTFELITSPPLGAIERNAVLNAEWWHTPFGVFEVTGSLKDGVNFLPVSGATIYISVWKDGQYVQKWTETTNSDGRFRHVQYASGDHDASTHPPLVRFPGMWSDWPAGVGTHWAETEVYATYNYDW